MNGIKGKNVLVTGSSLGIGRSIAIRYAQEGANVAINYRSHPEDAKEVEAICKKAGVKTVVIQGDMAVEADIINMVETTIKTLGSLDILVNNAAIQTQIPSHLRTTADFDKVLAVDIRGVFIASREAIKHFLSRKYAGNIVNITSPHEVIPKPGYIDYAISKAGLKNLTQTLALEYSSQKIRVNAVGPGATLTPMNKAWSNDPVKRAAVEKQIPLERAAEPEEIAPAVVFLSSEDASYITGVTLMVDGGACLYPNYKVNWSS